MSGYDLDKVYLKGKFVSMPKVTPQQPTKDLVSRLDLPSVISASAVESDNPFVDFQLQPPDQNNEKRHYVEAIVITEGVNQNMFEVLPEAMEMVAEGYKNGKPLSINHDKGNWTNTLGYGATVDAEVIDSKLHVLFYLALDKTYPQGPFGSSKELRDAIIDGFVGNVSQSIMPKKAKCSVCDKRYPLNWDEYDMEGICRHYRGQHVIVEDDEGNQNVEIVHIIVEEADAVELSLVMIPADKGSRINRPVVNSFLDFSVDNIIDEQRRQYLCGPAISASSQSDPDPIPNPSDNSGDPNKGGTPVSITQEQLDAMQKRAVDAESKNTTLQVELNSAKESATKLEGEKSTAQAEKATVEAEKATLQAKLEAEEAKVKLLEAGKELQDKEVEKKDARIQELEKEAKENAIVIKDGKEARASKIEEFVDAYAKAVGDDCTEDMKEAQREVAKSLTIEQIDKKVEGFLATAKVNFPPGSAIQGGNGNDDDEGGNGGGQQKRLVGV